MSDSTLKPSAAPDGGIPGMNGLSAGAISPRWWLASVGFHALLLVWVLFFSPVRVIDAHPKPATTHLSGARAGKIVEQIREKQAATIGENLRTLSEVGKKISTLETRKREEFATFAREMGKDVPARSAAEAQDIALVQAEALAALDLSVSNGNLYVHTRAGACFDALRDTQRLVREKQSRAFQLLEQAQALLSLGDARFAPAQATMAEAAAAQDRAAKAMAEAEAASDAAPGSRKRTAHEGQIEHFTYHLRRNRAIVLNADTNLVVAQRRVAIAQAVLDRRKTLADEAVKKASAKSSDAARAAVEAAKKAVESAERELVWARRLEAEVPTELANARKSVPELEIKVAQLLAQDDPERPAPTPEDRKLIEAHTRARQVQVEAQQAQALAAQALTTIQGIKHDAPAGTEALVALDQAAPAEPPPPPVDPKSVNLAQIYTSAQKTESSLTQSYRRLRALNLALVRRMPLAKAINLTEVTKPVRPDLAPALQASVTTGEAVVAAREAVQNAKAEVNAMVRLAESLLSQAQTLDVTLGSSISLNDYNRRFDDLQAMESIASEEVGGDVMDLTAAWGEGGPGDGGEGWSGNGEGGDGGPGGGGPGGGGQGGRGGPGGGGRGGPGGSGTGGSGGGLPNMGLTGVAGPWGSGTGNGTGNGTGTGGAPGGSGSGNGPGGFGLRGIRGAPGDIGRPENIADRVVPFPGRRVAAHGTSAKWFFADSWYILGPFDNTGRRNIDRKFPPEEVIDLNATYPGKNAVEIRWEFQQSATPNVMPHFDTYNAARRNPALRPVDNYMNSLQYSIYYAYTEVWFEKECDLWVAVGSDDFSKVWIEDKLVWSSGKNLKAWQLNEGLRKVHFKQGVNRVLYRVENGNNITEFSMVVSLLP